MNPRYGAEPAFARSFRKDTIRIDAPGRGIRGNKRAFARYSFAENSDGLVSEVNGVKKGMTT
jgi:hypothetical protein